ncbi:MAG TPA: M20/M25/M40 family metallo-hydrolase [Caulobacteraceae bacterium]|jgi:hypothetical protein|nr:M20/M25/M40 family metallo-hydrolase [Caulobacteraceae bacterium]
MRRLAALALILAAAFALFFVQATTWTPPAGAAPAARRFSEPAAFADIEVIGRAPHHAGSIQNALVRDYVVHRMQALGLNPRVQRAQSETVRASRRSLFITQTPVENVIGVLPGRDRSAPALALMAHYDSVEGSPGAADDAAGVASALEAVRALKAQGTPARDVMVVITDGEEIGLMGARAFFGQDPAARRIGFAINLEARGGGGRPAMFQTSPHQGEAIRLFQRVERGVTANSAIALAYSKMPNDTDFTVALGKGLAGFNFAWIGRQFDYHSPSSTPAVLDQGALRLMGEQTLALARPLAFDPALPRPAPDLVYSDLFGTMIAYPPGLGWALLAVAAALGLVAGVAGRRVRRPSLRWLASGGSVTIALIAIPAALLFLTRTGAGAAPGWMSYRPILARFPLFEAAMLAAAVGGLLLAGLAFTDRSRLVERWVGAIGIAIVAAAALQLAAPTAAFVLAWPLLAASLIAALTGAGERKAPALWILAGIVAVADLAWIGGFFHLLLQALDMGPALGLVAWLAGLALWPWLVPAAGRAAGAASVLFVIAMAAGLTIWLRLGAPYDARHPRATMPIEVKEADGSLWRASLSPADRWTRRWMGPGSIVELPIAGAPDAMVGEQVGRTSPPALPLAWSVRGDGAMVFTGAAAQNGELYLDITGARPLASVVLNGRAVAARGVTAVRIDRMGSPAGFSLVAIPAAGDRPKVRWAFWRDGTAPPMPSGLMAWDKAGDTVIAADPGLPPHR